MKKEGTVDEYIAAAPAGVRAKLREMREAIRAAAPEAEESISYRIPYYSYRGRLVWFGLFSEHISLFVRPPVLQEHRDELKGYSRTKSALHLPLDRKIPSALVRELVKAAMKKNEERESA